MKLMIDTNMVVGPLVDDEFAEESILYYTLNKYPMLGFHVARKAKCEESCRRRSKLCMIGRQMFWQ